MKKLFVVMTALMLVMGLTTAAMAAQQVEVKTNSEGITAAANACEKTGNITFAFDEGTVIQDGDWVRADLPLGVTLCKSFDFVVLGADGTGLTIPVAGGGGAGFSGTINASGEATTDDFGIWAITDTLNDGSRGGITVGGSSDMFVRVRGAAGTSTIRLDFYDEDANGISAAANYDGTSTLTVNPGGTFSIKLFDSARHDGSSALGIILAFNDFDADGTYGDSLASDLLRSVNDSDNTVCVTVDSAAYGGTTINASINSGGVSGSNFLTFNPSNPQVAHLIAATSITLEACKGDLYGYIEPGAGQNATCTFNYETAASYCSSTTFGGNTLLITNNSGTFFNPGDEYRMTLEISGNGAYFAGAPTAASFLSTEDPCNDAGIGVAAFDTPATETGTAVTGFAAGDCQAIAAGNAIVRYTTAASFTSIDTDNVIRVDVPLVAYDPAQFTNGDQIDVTLTMDRLPCGQIFSDDRIIAEIVDACTAAVPTTTLYYPYATPLDGSAGWWYGMTIGNPSTTAGTALVTVYESDGDVGTYTTPSIAAGGIVVYGGGDLLSNLTAAVGNAGTLGDAPCHIVVVTQYPMAGGFGMTGNQVDSTGYTAYTDANTWNN